jgi:hypothetical protein
MLRAILAAGLLLAASAAHAQPVPAGSGVLAFKEKLKTSCGSTSDAGTLTLVLQSNGSWSVDAPAGAFGGTLTALDPAGRTWRLDFDGGSLAAYEQFLEDAAADICASPVSISNLELGLVVKVAKDGTQVSAQLKATADGVAALFAGTGKHQLKAKGAFVSAALHGGSGASVILESFPWYESP